MSQHMSVSTDGNHPCNADCQYQCVVCGNWLKSEFETDGHWRLTGHSLFADRLNCAYQQTVEGLQCRHQWDTQRVREGVNTAFATRTTQGE